MLALSNTASGHRFRAMRDCKEENPVSEARNRAKRLVLDGSVKLEFRGARVAADAGPLVTREPDEALGLTEMAAEMFAEGRVRNRRHDLTSLL